MKKVFSFTVNSAVDVITNSSSELFVFKGKEKNIVEELIKQVYPDYLNEYEPLKSVNELTVDELDTYFQYATGCFMWPALNKESYRILDNFTFDELYEIDDRDNYARTIRYRLKETVPYKFVTEQNFDYLKNKLDPNKQMYFLFSRDDNPDWDYQEKLMDIADRYHLG